MRARSICWLLCLTSACATEPAIEREVPGFVAPRVTESELALRDAAFTFVAGGDVSFGREVGQSVLADPEYSPLRRLAPAWQDADLRFVNLESQLSDQNGETQSPRRRLVFTGPPGGAAVLAREQVHVVSTANNHAWDYGRDAFFETLAHLDAAGVRHAGSGADRDSAYAPVSLESNGRRIALFAVTQVWNYGPFERHPGREHVAWANAAELEKRIALARPDHDLVLVSYHGGAEYQDAPSQLSRSFAKAVIRAGADAVIGHHPHVIQGIGWIDDKPVFYSLGNLVFGPRSRIPSTRYGMLAKLQLTSDGARRFAICPYEIRGFEPVPLEVNSDPITRQRVLRQLRRASTATGGTRMGQTDEQGCVQVLPPAAPAPTTQQRLLARRD